MKKIFLYSLIVFLLGTNLSLAAEGNEYTLLEPLPCIVDTGNGDCKDGKPPITKINLDTYINYVFKFAIALAVFLSVVMIIWGGFEYMLSGIPFVKVNAKTRIENAILGLLGVLVSYLILLTIDPRLVRISTRIDPICPKDREYKPGSICDPEGLEEFESRLSNDLRALSVETQAKTTEALSKKQKLEDELTRIKYSIENDQELSANEINNLKVQKANLEQQIRDVNIDIDKNVATVIGQISFARAYSLLKKPDFGSTESLEQYTVKPISNTLLANGQYPTNSPNIIQADYNNRLNRILKNSEGMSEAEKLANIQTLEKQRDFYIAQVKEEVELTRDVRIRETGVLSKVTWDKNTILLEERLKKYNNNINNQEGAVSSGIPTIEYNKIMQARVSEVENALKRQRTDNVDSFSAPVF